MRDLKGGKGGVGKGRVVEGNMREEERGGEKGMREVVGEN